VNKALANEDFSKNLIIHDNPKNLSKIEFKNINLQNIDLAKNKGKIMILNFWATWCAPCKKEMPSLDKLSLYFKDKILIFPINLEKPNKKKTTKFFKDLEILNLNIFYDPEFKLAKKFKMRGLPTTILIDKNGMEFGRIIGEFNFEDENFKNLIQRKI
tara:strand:- start:3840 stop:4313 length:474 start_codon:yes stop_codon:yes gene_type:complete